MLNEKKANGAKMTEFCIQETWRSVKLLHQKELVDAFNANEKNWAGKPRAATEPVCRDAINAQLWMCGLQQEFGWLRISRPSSDLWGGIGTTTQTTQQMGGGPGIKRQSAPDAFLSFPRPGQSCDTFMKTMPTTNAIEWWPVQGEKMDVQFLHVLGI